jgi:hypothetical protein
MMGNVYLWKVDGCVIAHTNLEAAEQLDGLSREPDKTITEDQYSAAGGLARVINNKIVLGKTQRERDEEEARTRIAEIDASFAEIERKMLRPMAAHVKGNPDAEDIQRLDEYEAGLKNLRAERAEKMASLSAPME